MIVGALGMALVLLIRAPENSKIHPGDLWMFFGTRRSQRGVFQRVLFHRHAAQQVSIAVVLLYTSPVFVMLMSALFFPGADYPLKLVALGMTMAGSVCVAGLLGAAITCPGGCCC